MISNTVIVLGIIVFLCASSNSLRPVLEFFAVSIALGTVPVLLEMTLSKISRRKYDKKS